MMAVGYRYPPSSKSRCAVFYEVETGRRIGIGTDHGQWDFWTGWFFTADGKEEYVSFDGEDIYELAEAFTERLAAEKAGVSNMKFGTDMGILLRNTVGGLAKVGSA